MTMMHRLRLARGQTLRALAADVGCSYETIRLLESGAHTRTTPRVREGLERALGLPLEALLVPVDVTAGDRR